MWSSVRRWMHAHARWLVCVRGTALNFPNINHPKWFTQVLPPPPPQPPRTLLKPGGNALASLSLSLSLWAGGRVAGLTALNHVKGMINGGRGKATFNTIISVVNWGVSAFRSPYFPCTRSDFSFLEMTFFSITFVVLSQSDSMGRTPRAARGIVPQDCSDFRSM